MHSADDLAARIARLKTERRAVILAHNYQRAEVQDVADFTGDSLELARAAAATEARVIVFCGVYFMAESASILNPGKTVLLPVREAGCPLADMLDARQLREWKAAHPGRPVVTYINSSAEVKAESDICCTSSNAAAVVESLDAEEVLFGPDMNLAAWVQARTRKRLVVWNGYCATHAWVRPEDVLASKRLHPGAVVMAHPECGPAITALADVVCSTSGMLAFARSSPAREFIVLTEAGILHRLLRDNPGKQFHLGSRNLLCPNMKLTTLASVAESLERMRHEVRVEADIRARAARALERMLEVR